MLDVPAAWPDLEGRQQPVIRYASAYASTSGPEVAELAAQAGLALDPWQQLFLADALGEKSGGRWAAFEAALVVARQNGKGSIFEARVLGGLFLLDEQLIMYSAHEFKALDVATPMLTPSGWSTMGDLRDGDEVFAPDGQPTKVVAAHPVRYGRPCFRVKFDDGQEVIADEDHLWSVLDVDAGERRVLTTRQMLEGRVSRVQPRTGRDRRTYRFRVDVPAPLTMPDADLPIPPWLLGAWLGDGTTAKGELTVGADELDYITGRLAALGETWTIRPDRRNPRVLTVTISGLRDRLRATGVLGHKHIPVSYLKASETQRRLLLAGIMDTDGTVAGHRINVTMVKRELVEGILALVRSLGYKATMREFRARLNGADAGPMWRVAFTSSQDVSPFGMPRKTAALKPREPRMTRAHYNAVVAIEPVPSRPTRCITVAHESSCYLAGPGLVPTHNTAQEMFRRIEGLIAGGISAGLAKRVLRVSRSNGEEGIELRSGQRLRFMARSTGSGRGFSGDCNIWDEAQHLGDAPVDALMPTMSARPNPQLLYGGSAPDKNLAPCEQLARVRRRALKGGDPSLVYHEYSAELCTDECPHGCDAHDDPADPATWAKTNPALGHRISVEHVAREHVSMSREGFNRERLSVGNWPTEGSAWEVISEEAWTACADPASTPVDPISISADVTPNRGHGSIAIAGQREDGLGHVEVIDHRSGTTWMVPRLVELVVRWNPCRLVIDSGGPAGSLIPELVAALAEQGVELEVTSPTYREVAQACGVFYDAVVRPPDAPADWVSTLRHRDEAELNAALAEAQKRPLGEAWAWSRKTQGVVISPLVAATHALWGFSTRSREEKPAPATAPVAPPAKGGNPWRQTSKLGI